MQKIMNDTFVESGEKALKGQHCLEKEVQAGPPKFLKTITLHVYPKKAHMHRQKNVVETREDEMPKFGAGSEYGRDQRIEARRKRKGYVKKVTKDEDLPWLLKTGGRGGRK